MVEDQSTVQKVSFIGRYVRLIRPVGDLAPAVFAEAWVLPIFPVNWQVPKDLRTQKTQPVLYRKDSSVMGTNLRDMSCSPGTLLSMKTVVPM